MQKKFVTNLALLLFLNLLIKPFWILGIDRAVQNEVGAYAFGDYFTLFNFTFLLNILLDLGITNFNNKNIAQNNHLLTKHFSSLIVLKFILAVAYIFIAALCGIVWGYDFREIKILLILGFNQFLISFVLYLRSNLTALHLFKTDSVVSILDRTIMIATCALLLWGNVLNEKFDVLWYMYAQAVAYLITALIAFVVVIKNIPKVKLTFSLPFALMILKKSFPFAVLVLLMTFYNRIDSVMLEKMLPDGKEQSGIYAQAYRLLDAANMIAYLFSIILLPMFSRMLKYKESVEQLVKTSVILLLIPGIIVAAGCIFYGKNLMELMYKEHIEDSSIIFGMLMSCFMAISMTYIFGTLLTANGNLKQLNIMAACGMVVNIALNIILIPHYKVFGSAMASIITQFGMAISQIIIAQYKFKFRVNYRLLTMLILFTAGVIFINYASLFFNFTWMINFVIMIALSGLWAFAIRLLNIKSMLRILKYG